MFISNFNKLARQIKHGNILNLCTRSQKFLSDTHIDKHRFPSHTHKHSAIHFEDHYPVMWRKILDLIDDHVITDNETPKVFLDLTLGCGNHTKLILDRYPNVYMVGVDLDSKMVDYASNKLSKYIEGDRLVIVEDNYVCVQDLNISELFSESDKFTFPEKKKFDFMLLDLGFNSMQLEDMEKGLSFKNPHSSLDMRYDTENDNKSKASDILNHASELELMEIFHKNGDEKNYEAVARNVIKRRDEKRIETVGDFLKVIDESYIIQDKFNLYTRLFQALRIAVNYELVNVQRFLNKAFFNMELNGVLATISFHSAEDKIVKHALRECERLCLGKNIIKKGEKPSKEELDENSRSHSAILRAFRFNPYTK